MNVEKMAFQRLTWIAIGQYQLNNLDLSITFTKREQGGGGGEKEFGPQRSSG